MLKKYFYALLIIVLLFGCDSPTESEKDFERGEIVSSHLIVSYTVEQLQELLNLFDFSTDFTLIYDFKVYNILYQSVDVNGDKILLSGALMIPVNKDNPSMLTINHGTVTSRTDAASIYPLRIIEGPMGMIATSIGYVTLIPDYPGFGSSYTMHPYIHAKSLAISVIDFIRAGRAFCTNNGISLNEKLFLGGYSEGGYVTMATHKEIEENYADEFSLTAVAPMAGPHNLSWMAHHILAKSTYDNPAYLAFMMTAYNKTYGWNKLGEIFNEPYASNMPGYFDGSNRYAEINNALPTTISTLFKQSFLDSFLAGNETTLDNALAENTLLGWDPVAPIRMYHGDADSTVFYKNSVDAKVDFESRGATNIELITIPGGTHMTAGEDAFNGMINWINSF